MTTPARQLTLDGPEQTAALAARIGPRLRAGDTLLLDGAVGAGKTHFARALIQSILDVPEDVPSPTFTLVQEYETAHGPLWHADLYRLTGPDEVEELGLRAAFDQAICLVEWPDRLGPHVPRPALTLSLKPGDTDDSRIATLGGNADRWADLLAERANLADAFIAAAGWADAARTLVAGDASNRRYDRLTQAGQSVILMDAPPSKGEDVRPFVRIAAHLRSVGLSAPEIIAADPENGFLLLEDLGDAIFAGVLEREPDAEMRLYSAAIDVLVHLHARSAPPLLPYDAAMMTDRALLAFDWYQRAARGAVDAAQKSNAEGRLSALLEPLDASVLVQRDYHAENLIWLPARADEARVGLLDFQDAMLGHPAYDLCSVLLDARRDVATAVQDAMLTRYMDAARITDRAGFMRAYWTLALQRNLRIAGVFARLCLRDGKAHYVDLLPRVWRHVEAALNALGDAALASDLRTALPAPDPTICERIKAQCATLRTP